VHSASQPSVSTASNASRERRKGTKEIPAASSNTTSFGVTSK